VVSNTQAPRWFASVLLVLNTVIVTLLQVKLSAGSERPTGAARSYRRAGIALGAAAVAFSLTGLGPAGWAVPMLIVAIAVHSLGEILHASGQFGLSYGLAPAHSVSEYQAVFSLGMGFSRAFAPAFLTFVCVLGGAPGWIAISAMFIVTGLIMPRASAHAEQRRTLTRVVN
jgi:hypothetical protein